MSAANDLLKKIIGKLNAAVKTEPMTLPEEEKTIARINIGAQAAIYGAPGQLLYIAADGSVTPLTLGYGLEIVDGVLNVTVKATAKAICGEATCGSVICGA